LKDMLLPRVGRATPNMRSKTRRNAINPTEKKIRNTPR